MHLVDTDTHELVSGWLLQTSTSLPLVTKTFQVDLRVGEASHKKIMYKNPWDEARKYVLRSSNESIMRPRYARFQVAAQGEEFLRLWFAGIHTPGTKDIYLFVNDALDQNEECLLIQATWS